MSEIRGVIEGKLVDVGVTTGYVMRWIIDGKESTRRERANRLQVYMEKGAVIEHAKYVDGQTEFDGDFYRKLPIVKTKYKIVDTIKRDDGVTVGYDLCTVDDEQSTSRVSIFTAWKLAADGCIEKAEAHVVRGLNKKILVRIEENE